ADAIIVLMQSGENGHIYNIGSDDEFNNIQIAQMICTHLGISFQEHVIFVEDRPFNDCRYALDTSKLKRLGWSAKRPLDKHMARVVPWYRDNAHRYADQFPLA